MDALRDHIEQQPNPAHVKTPAVLRSDFHKNTLLLGRERMAQVQYSLCTKLAAVVWKSI